MKTLRVNYTELIPILIQAIKDLKQENNTLKQETAKIEALENRTKTLQKDLQQIKAMLSLTNN